MIKFEQFFITLVFPVSVSGMITLPVTAQMYHSLVQQQMPNNDNTVCVTPMQVQNFIASNSLCSGSIANTNSTAYLMATNNQNNVCSKNIINMAYQTTTSCHVKTVLANPATATTAKINKVIKKPLNRKKILNVAFSKQKPNNNINNDKNNSSKVITKCGEKSHVDNNNIKHVKDRNELKSVQKKYEVKHLHAKALTKPVNESKLKKDSPSEKEAQV